MRLPPPLFFFGVVVAEAAAAVGRGRVISAPTPAVPVPPGDVEVEDALLREAVDVFSGDGATDGDVETGVVAVIGERYAGGAGTERTSAWLRKSPVNFATSLCKCPINRRAFPVRVPPL